MKFISVCFLCIVIFSCSENLNNNSISQLKIESEDKDSVKYWVNKNYYNSLHEELSICECWQKNRFHFLHIDTTKLELIIHSNLFHFGMDSQGTFPLKKNGNHFEYDTTVQSFINETIEFNYPTSNEMTLVVGETSYTFIRKSFQIKDVENFSPSQDMYAQSYPLNSYLLLKYNQIDTFNSTQILIPIDSLRYFIESGNSSTHCSDDYQLDGLTIKGKKNRHFELEFSPGKVILYESQGRNRYQKLKLDTLPKQTMVIGN